MSSSSDVLGPLPSSFTPSRIPVRTLVMVGAALACSAWSFAGIYPQFDQGSLRWVLALTSAPFAALIVMVALKAKTAQGAFGKTMALTAALGWGSTLVPSLCLGSGNMVLFMTFGLVFGIATGLFYGVPLGLLVGFAHRHVRASSHAGTDRAARLTGGWLLAMALVALGVTRLFDASHAAGHAAGHDEGLEPGSRHARYEADDDEVRNVDVGPHRPTILPSYAAGAAALAGALLAAHAGLRLRRRSRWLARVASGEVPSFRLRGAAPELIEHLPRIGNGSTVIEWFPSVNERTAPSAYRGIAMGTPLAIVDDAPLATV